MVLTAALLVAVLVLAPAPSRAETWSAARVVSTMAVCPSAAGHHANCVWYGRGGHRRLGASFVTHMEVRQGVPVFVKERIRHTEARRLVREIRRAAR